MKTNQKLVHDFPAMHMVRTGRVVRFLGKVTFVVLIASVFVMIFVPWRQTARGYGQVVALDPQQRPQSVLSQIKGNVKFVKSGLREGSKVEQGEILLRLDPSASEAVSLADSQIVAIESKLLAAEGNLRIAEQAAELQEQSGQKLNESLVQDFRAAQQKWEQSKNEVDVTQAELKDKQNQLRIAEEVLTKGLVSKEEVFSKRQDYEAQRAKVLKAENAAEESYAALRSKEEEIESKKREIDIKNRSANQKVLDEIQKLKSIEKELLDLKTKRDEFNRLEVRAPRSGVIQEWFGLEGSDTVKEGDKLFTIVPDTSELAVELKISGNDMPLVKEGDHVRLQFEGWPAVQFVGWPSVAVGTFGGKVNRVFPTDDGKGSFSLVVIPDQVFEGESPWPDDRYLRQGVRVNGWVLLRQVTLGYEIWRQLNGFPPTIADEAPKKESKVKLPKF